MHDDRSDEHKDIDGGPEKVFRTLKGRPTDELDSAALWRRIEGDLEPRAASWIDRLAAAIGLGGLQPATLRFAGAGAVAVLIVAVVWLAPGPTANPPAPESPAPESLVAEAPGEPAPLAADAGTESAAPATPGSEQPAWILDVRLVRGYSGELPADAMVSAAAGAGGADRLADLRGALDELLPFEQIALVGQWQGALEPSGGPANEGAAATIARLSDAFELRFAVEDAGTGVTLADVLLDGAGRPLVAAELALAPGSPYLFGVQAEGEASDTGSLVLAVRLLPAEPGGQSAPSDPDARPDPAEQR